MDIIDIALARNFAKSAVKNVSDPATVKSIVPTYSTVDPTKVLYNTVTFEWTASGGTKQTQSIEVQNGAGIASVTLDRSTEDAHYYSINLLDGSHVEFVLPSAEMIESRVATEAQARTYLGLSGG